MHGLQLLACVLAFHTGISHASINCSAAVAGLGNCSSVQLIQSMCYSGDDDYNYQSMRARCNSSRHSECCSSSRQTCSGCYCFTPSWSSYSGSLSPHGSSPPSSHPLTLLPLPIDYDSFNLTISWPTVDNVSRYVVAVKDELKVIAKFRTTDLENRELTIPSLCYDSRDSILTVKLWRKFQNGTEIVDHTSIRRENCYTLYSGDHIMQRRHCGPSISDEVAVHEVKVCSVNDAELRVSWPEAPDADSYELTVINWSDRGHKTWYNATTTTAVILSGFNMTHSYSIRIRPYIECAGMYMEGSSWQPCTGDAFPLSLPTTTCQQHLPSSAATPFPTTHLTSSPTITPSSSPPHPSPSSSPPSLSSLAPSPPTVLIAGITVLVAILLLTPLALFLLMCRLCHKSTHPKLPPIPPSPTTVKPLLQPTSPLPSPTSSLFSPPPVGMDGYVHESSAVWVLYSLETPEDQQTNINQILLAGLAKCGISAQTPGSIANRRLNREWLERGVTEATAVLLVCNDQFYTEWLSEGGGGGGVKMGHEAKMLKNGVSPQVLAKFAYVHFEESDKEFDSRYCKMLSPYITNRFSLAGDRTAAVISVAGFVMNSPKYEL